MPACTRCGRENPADARFCNACGEPLGAEPSGRGDVRKTVTVLFADVTGSTALGERHDPEATRRVIGRWFETAREVLEGHGGRVEKFVGDAVMAVFGVPTVHEDDAFRAVRAAGDLQTALATLNDELERDHGVRIDVRTGVNTGEVVAGEGDTLVTGDAVNVAARLEQAARPGEALLGEATLRLVRDAVEVEPAGALELKGKSHPVSAYRLLTVDQAAAPFARRLDASLVGRTAELAQLRQAFERVAAERTAYLFTVLGPAGIGKSRLVDELLTELGEAALAVRGHCLSYGQGITYRPLAEILGGAPDGSVTDALAGDDEGRLVQARLAAATVSEGAPVSTEETAWAARRLFERLAAERPLVVVVDDLHWAEPTLLDLVDHVAEWSRDAPILLLCLARSDLLDVRPTWGGGRVNATTLLLEPLTDDESAQLMETLPRGASLPATVRTRIREAAEGNPLFVEQMLAMLEDGSGEDTKLVVPPTIQALLAARLDGLPPGERAAADCASVEGKVFHRSALVELSAPEARGDVGAHLAGLFRKELIRPDASSFAGDEAFRFRHQLIRDAAYDAISKEARAELHERFADWLGRRGDDAADVDELVGYHLEQAFRHRMEVSPADDRSRQLARRAADRLLAAGERAVERRDAPAAGTLLTRAIALLSGDDTLRPRALWALAEAVVDGGEYARAAGILREAEDAAAGTGQQGLAQRARLWRLYAGVHAGEVADAEVLAEATAALEVFGRLGDERGLADALALRGRIRFWQGAAAEAELSYEASLAHARAAGARRRETETLAWLIGAKAHGPTPVAEAIAFCDEILAGARRDPLTDLFAWEKRGQLLAMRGEFDEGRESVRRARAIAQEFGLALRYAYSADYVARVELLAGDLETAERELRDALSRLEALGEKVFQQQLAWQLAEVLYRRGSYTEARAFALAGDAVFAIEGDAVAQARRAKILARLGEADEAASLAAGVPAELEHSDLLDETGVALRDVAEAFALLGDTAGAVAAARRARELFERKGNVVARAEAEAFLLELEALT